MVTGDIKFNDIRNALSLYKISNEDVPVKKINEWNNDLENFRKECIKRFKELVDKIKGKILMF